MTVITCVIIAAIFVLFLMILWVYFVLKEKISLLEPLPERPLIYGGYQPTHGTLDPNNPPKGGSGLYPKKTLKYWPHKRVPPDMDDTIEYWH